METLDRMFLPLKIGWEPTNLGLNVEIKRENASHSERHPDMMVCVRPVGWPEDSYVSVRIMAPLGTWKAYEGTMYLPALRHLSLLFCLEGFAIYDGQGDSPSYITTSREGNEQNRLILRALKHIRHDLYECHASAEAKAMEAEDFRKTLASALSVRPGLKEELAGWLHTTTETVAAWADGSGLPAADIQESVTLCLEAVLFDSK